MLTVLYGLSGLGKTSLLRAGLFPKLREKDVFPIYIRLDFSEHRLPFVEQVLQIITRESQHHEVAIPDFSVF